MVYYLYILHSKSSDKFYVGYSSNPQERLIDHNTSEKNTLTSKHRPWELVALFKVGENKNEALQIERFIKNQKSRKPLEKLINPTFIPTGKIAQLVRVPNFRG